uniref:Uncharacterized protein n=1 Tax=Oryza sativa subsp. japonica TaxID=39947 RepID=Q60EJ5_ORYSJ|nr:hypothetical protein [Oryza sativa Japonica Group]
MVTLAPDFNLLPSDSRAGVTSKISVTNSYTTNDTANYRILRDGPPAQQEFSEKAKVYKRRLILWFSTIRFRSRHRRIIVDSSAAESPTACFACCMQLISQRRRIHMEKISASR